MVSVMFWDIVSIFFLGSAFSILIMGSIFYFKRGRKKESSNEKLMLYAFAGMLISFANMALFTLLSAIFVVGTYENSGFYINTAFNEINVFFDTFIKLTYFSLFLGSLIFIIMFEKTLKRTKYLLSLIGAVFTIMPFFVQYDSEVIMLPYAYVTILGIIVLIIFTRWSQLEYKVISSHILMGYVCIGWAGTIRGIITLFEYPIVPVWVPSLLMCLGGIFMLFPMFFTPKNLKRSLFYSVLFELFVIGLQFTLLFRLVFSPLLIETILLGFPFTGLYFYKFYYTIKTVRAYYSKGTQSMDKSVHPDIWGMFTRPGTITEEEVSISKEKKVCLVCKNEVSRINYLCPECKTFYCLKCSEALSNLENQCWACNVPIDESKPIKPFEKEEAEVVTEEDVPKKGKGFTNIK